MMIRKILLQTRRLEELKHFYTAVLQFPLREDKADIFSVEVGATQLTFQKQKESDSAPFYHFAFGISEKGFDPCYQRLKAQGCTLMNQKGREVEISYMWKGKQVYFEDPEGNIGEVLAFAADSDALWLSVQEMGLPVENVKDAAKQLSAIPTEYTQESESFSFYGDQQGVFVLVKKSRPWYPTDRPATIHPMEIEVDSGPGSLIDLPHHPYRISR
ncbi:VOC family protein [Brevibacillus nitrificans]|uniref:VOC family protein n=1 Tax=Brevibacillus nitrificans TaxID=651560 RepID=UPI0028618FBF|nr:VOC family protein [Brevibacillus nitrificans]MDR7316979.1 catechol-2,3-dioxygenase [Brevibacillus nitrificans]